MLATFVGCVDSNGLKYYDCTINGRCTPVSLPSDGGFVDTGPLTSDAGPVVRAVSLLAGSVGGLGNIDGTRFESRLAFPASVVADKQGNLFIAEAANHIIRKVTPSGDVSLFAGKAGMPGDEDGQGEAARFREPFGLAIDGAGLLYVADSGNHIIRRISPNGLVVTLAGGKGLPGAVDGPDFVARFHTPYQLAIVGPGIVYVADSGNGAIRQIDAQGQVVTVAGKLGELGFADGTTVEARFNRPTSLLVASPGIIYLSDQGNHAIRRISFLTSPASVSTLAGAGGMAGFADGVGAAARFNIPFGLALMPDGSLLVGDTGNHALRLVTPSGEVSTVVGSPEREGSSDGSLTTAQLKSPAGIWVESSVAVLFADFGNHTIRRFELGKGVTTVAGSAPSSEWVDAPNSTAARFRNPSAVVALESGDLIVSDTENNCLRRVKPSGAVTTLAGRPGPAATVDGPGELARFAAPTGLAVGPQDMVYVADTNANVIRSVSSEGTVRVVAGLAGQAGSVDGPAAQAKFSVPQGVALSPAGELYVADTGNHAIRRISKDGQVSTFVGAPGTKGTADGPGTTARFSAPRALAFDQSGTLYVADTGNHSIRTVTPQGLVRTLAGKPGTAGANDGAGDIALFSGPVGLSVDDLQNVFVADPGNCAVRKVTSGGVVSTVVGLSGKCGIRTGETPTSIGRSSGLALLPDGRLAFLSESAVLTLNVLTP